jgi:hypothetical protein
MLEFNVLNRNNINMPEPITNPLQGDCDTSQSALDIAVMQGDHILVDKLLEVYSANPDGVKLVSGRRSRPLKLAIEVGHEEVVKVLLEYDAEPSMGQIECETAQSFVDGCTGEEGAIHDIMKEALEIQHNERWLTPIRARHLGS